MQTESEFLLRALSALSVVAVAGFARFLERSILAPGSFIGHVWIIFGAVPLLFVSNMKVSGIAGGVIALFVLAVATGSLAGISIWPASRVKVARDLDKRQQTLLSVAVFGGSLTTFPVALSYVQAVGGSAGDLFSMEGWLSLAVRISVGRYSEDLTPPFVARVLLGVLYASAVLGGILARQATSRVQRLAAVAPLIGGCAIGLLTTVKASILLPIYLFAAGWSSLALAAGTGLTRVVSLGTLLRGVIAVLAVTCVLIASFVLRYSGGGEVPVALLLDRVSTYAFGHMSAFSAWLDFGGAHTQHLEFGRLTFGGVAAMLGFGERIQGIYDERFDHRGYSGESNVFTAFRGLIEDASLPGAMVCMFLTGVVLGYLCARQKSGYSGPFSTTALSAFYAFALWSPVASIFAYNSIILGFGLVWGVLAIADRAGLGKGDRP